MPKRFDEDKEIEKRKDAARRIEEKKLEEELKVSGLISGIDWGECFRGKDE